MDTYLKIGRIVQQAEKLDYLDFVQLVKTLTQKLKHKKTGSAPQKVRLTDLKGLGKECWQNLNIEQYIDNERDNW